MSVQTEIDRIIGLVEDAHEKVLQKGGTTSAPYLLAKLPAAIESIPGQSASQTVYIGSTEPDASVGVDGDIYIIRSDGT